MGKEPLYPHKPGTQRHTKGTTRIDVIHESLVNGNRQQMVEQIDSYGLYDFWADYKDYLRNMYDLKLALEYFTDATISYFRIKNR